MKKIFFSLLIVFVVACHHQQKIFSVKGLYVADLFCADCSGIHTQLQINKDSSFWLYEKYRFGKIDLPFLDSGKWKIKDDKIILTGTTQVPHQFKIINDSVLQMLDSDGNEIESKHSNQFKAGNKNDFLSMPIGDTISGTYNFKENTFKDCLSQNKVPLIDKTTNPDLQIQKNTKDAVFVQFIGYYSLQKILPNQNPQRVFVARQSIKISLVDSCR